MSEVKVKSNKLSTTEDEHIEIEKAYQALCAAVKVKTDPEDQANIQAAYELAVKAHAPQRRKSGEPYIFHPIAVARICAEEIGLGPTAIVAALLHDVVEDTAVSLEDLDEQFGSKITNIVDGLTKLDNAYDAESPQAENFKKVLSTLIDDVRVVLIKMADRLHNMRTLGAMPRHKQLKIASETEFIYAPLAHRLGLYAFKTEFQDLCMKIREPETYHQIAKKLRETKRSREAYIQAFIKPIETHLDEMDIPYRITGRPKSIYSISNKIKNKKVSFEEIYDLFAVRIILDAEPKKEKPACWIAYSSVTDIYHPIPERLKDWITTPKSNGYESLHTTVVGPNGRYVEVQIRSERMDEISEKGFAAHWKYKGVSAQPDVYDRWLGSVRELLENKDSDAIEFLNDFKTNLFSEEVYVYTPKGDMRILPKGATALDFAFDIHTEVGYHCTAIKINNALVRIGYKLRNGDQIEVITNKNQKPNEDWLKIVVTGKARSRIRAAMKEERRKKGELGKEALERKFKNLKVPFDEKNVEKVVEYYKLKSRIDLFYAIAMEEINLQDFSKYFQVENNALILIKITEPLIGSATTDENPAPVARKNKKEIDPSSIVINGQSGDHFKYSLSACCKPVQGDDIFAYMSNNGCKIHRASCPNATQLMANYGYRIMKAEWASSMSNNFVADIVITGVDSGRGVIERISQTISTFLDLNIRSFHIDGNQGFFEGRIKLIVSNKNQLNHAIHALKEMDGIQSVVRVS